MLLVPNWFSLIFSGLPLLVPLLPLSTCGQENKLARLAATWGGTKRLLDTLHAVDDFRKEEKDREDVMIELYFTPTLTLRAFLLRALKGGAPHLTKPAM